MPLGKRKRMSYAARAARARRTGTMTRGAGRVLSGVGVKRAKTALSLARVSRQVSRINRMIETKEVTHQFSPNQAMPHNLTVQLADNDSVTNMNIFRLGQGAADTDIHAAAPNNRIGDSIAIKGVKLRFFLENSLGRSKVYYRIMLLRAPRGDASLNTTTLRSALFKGRTNNKMLDGIDTKRYRVIWQTQCTVQPTNPQALTVGVTGVPATGTPAGTASKIVSAWIPGYKFGRSGVIQYEQGSASLVKFYDYIVVFVAYDWFGTPQDVNNVGQLNEGYSTVYFKDA